MVPTSGESGGAGPWAAEAVGSRGPSVESESDIRDGPDVRVTAADSTRTRMGAVGAHSRPCGARAAGILLAAARDSETPAVLRRRFAGVFAAATHGFSGSREDPGANCDTELEKL